MTILLFPRAFAVIIAASAQATSSRGFIACSGPCATPTETLISPARSMGRVSSRSISRRASPSASPALHDGMITANSSPPRRQTMSEPRTSIRTASESAIRIWSPTAWPQTSFTRLKSSMSNMSRVTESRMRLVRRRAGDHLHARVEVSLIRENGPPVLDRPAADPLAEEAARLEDLVRILVARDDRDELAAALVRLGDDQ